MTRTIGRAVAAALIAGLLGAVWVALLYAWHPALRLELDRDLPRSVTGIYGAERDDAAGLTFAWTAGDAVLRLPGLDRGAAWTLDLRLRGGRPGPNPAVAILADGVVIATHQSEGRWTDVRVDIPPRPERRGLVLGIRASETMVPGPSDPRPLGVMLDRLALTPTRIVLVPRRALEAAFLAAAPIGAAIALLGVTAGSAIGGAIVLTAGTAAILARGFGPFTDYGDTATTLGLGIGLALAAIAVCVRLRAGHAPRNTARFAIAFSAAALFLKLLVLLHPNMPIGDAMFHAHRFQGVLAGRLYFTSIAPGGYLFPYPPGLYVFAAAFAGLVRRGVADVVLLRVVTAAVDAAAGILLYAVIAAVWRNRLAGAIAVAIYHLVPVNFAVLTTGNLTNAFAQSVGVAALALAGSGAVRLDRGLMAALLTAVLAAAYLSHTSTVAILFVAMMATAALFALRGEPALRSTAAAVALAAIAAAIVAVAIYYAHFLDTYRSELTRVARETAANASDAGGRTAGDRLAGLPYFLRINIGLPALALAGFGAYRLFRRPAPDTLSLAAGGWAASCLLFLTVGVLTPVDLRYYLAAVPAVAIAAGYGASWAWNESATRHRRWWRAGTIVVLAAAIVTGFENWWNTLG